MQGLGATAAAGAGFASTSSASAVDPIDVVYPQHRLLNEGVQHVGAGVSAWVGGRIGDILGDEDDYSGYTGIHALEESIINGCLNLAREQEYVLNGLENTVDYSRSSILPKVMAEVIDVLNEGGDNSDMADVVAEEVDEYYSSIQEDVINHYNTQHHQLQHYFRQWYVHEDKDDGTLPVYFNTVDDRLRNPTEEETPSHDYADVDLEPFNEDEVFYLFASDRRLHFYEYELLNGEQKDFFHFYTVSDSGSHWHTMISLKPDESSSHNATNTNQNLVVSDAPFEEDADLYEPFFHAERYVDLLTDIEQAYDDVIYELDTFVNDVYNAYDAGDIDLSDVVDPITAYTQLRAEDDTNAFAGANAAMLGIPSSGSDFMTVELHEPDVVIDGAIYATDAPEGGFTVGDTYDPDTLDGAVFLRYSGAFEDDDGNVEEETGFVQLDGDFTILEATDEDGGDLETVEIVEEITYDTTDVDNIEEQLAQVRETQIELQEEAQSQTGGGFSLDAFDMGPVPGPVVALAAAGLVVYGVITN